MYRIVKRIVRTITVVTWAIRYSNADGHTVEEEITLPELHQIRVEELPNRAATTEQPPASRPNPE